MSNTGRIAIDDNAVIHEFYRQEDIELGLVDRILARNQKTNTRPKPGVCKEKEWIMSL